MDSMLWVVMSRNGVKGWVISMMDYAIGRATLNGVDENCKSRGRGLGQVRDIMAGVYYSALPVVHTKSPSQYFYPAPMYISLKFYLLLILSLSISFSVLLLPLF